MANTLTPVFDLGGVFLDWDPLNLFYKLFDTQEEAIWFHQNICTLAWNLEFDAGVRFVDGVNSLIPQHPKYWRQIQAYDTRWKEMLAGVFQGTIDIHNELIDAQISTFAITNFSTEKWISILEDYEFLSKFDGVVVSGVEKLVKPDARIYQIFCQRFDKKPEECVFIDDNEVNIYAAVPLACTRYISLHRNNCVSS